MWKNFRKAIYSIILTGVLSQTFVFGGCVNTKDGKPRIYIEVKNPLTGEWVSQTETYGGNISCKWEYGREMPEKLEYRFKQGKKYIKLESWKGENLTGTGEDRFLELTLQQGQYCDIYTEVTDAFYIDGDSSYILRITKAEEL